MKEQNNPASSLRRSIRQHWIMGSLVVAVCFFGTGIWASFAELSSAAIAAGKVSPDGSLRVVQHLEGGIVRHLNVKEGDVVKDGQLLMVLDQALATANYLSIYRKHQRYVVTRDRLLAQERGDETFEVQMPSVMSADKSYTQFVANEITKFKVRRELLGRQQSTYHVQAGQVEAEISSLKAQIDGMDDQILLLDKELDSKKVLMDKGLMRQPELLALQRKRAELWSERNAIGSTIARARQKIEEIKIAELTALSEEREKVAKELSEINAEIAQADEALSATSDILSRTEILSDRGAGAQGQLQDGRRCRAAGRTDHHDRARERGTHPRHAPAYVRHRQRDDRDGRQSSAHLFHGAAHEALDRGSLPGWCGRRNGRADGRAILHGAGQGYVRRHPGGRRRF
ncbi:MAG: biotin/lipoyl-binding protein [Roseibium sp.]|nr:biotin/lipoyl-binding protein [Roseibium sp.]MBO6858310.1 biotin/lipoyl-binding protein [Roseibium sp.]